MLFADNEALALYRNLKLSKNKYKLLRKSLKEKNVNVLPSYNKIANASTKCYPPNSTIEIDKTGVT